MKENLQGKRVLVVGMARSGLAAAALLLAHGATAVLSDTRPEIEGVEALVAGGAEARLAEPAETLVDGCALVVLSPAVPPDAPVIEKAKALGIPVVSELELAYQYIQGTVVAITGTNGKTTTTSLIGDILKNAGKVVHVGGNIGVALSALADQTTPEDYTIVEVSSFQLEHIDTFHPQIAALLNLTPDHLNRHGTMEVYGGLKEGMLRNQTKKDFLVYNADDAFCVDVASRAAAQTVPFSRTQVLTEGAWVEDGHLMVEGRALCLVSQLSLPGPHNLENALAAAAIAAKIEIPAAVIRHTLRTFAGVEHRMETVRTVRGVKWINDSKGTNPESSMRGVQSMDVPTVLIAGGDEKGTDFTVFTKAIVDNPQIEHVVLIGKTAGRLRKSLEEQGYNNITMAGENFELAVRMAGLHARDGGAVLMSPACASFDMFKDFEERGNRFKELVMAL